MFNIFNIALFCSSWLSAMICVHFALPEFMYGCFFLTLPLLSLLICHLHYNMVGIIAAFFFFFWETSENIMWFSAPVRWKTSSIYCLRITILTTFAMQVDYCDQFVNMQYTMKFFQSLRLLSYIISFQMHHRRRGWVTKGIALACAIKYLTIVNVKQKSLCFSIPDDAKASVETREQN